MCCIERNLVEPQVRSFVPQSLSCSRSEIIRKKGMIYVLPITATPTSDFDRNCDGSKCVRVLMAVTVAAVAVPVKLAERVVVVTVSLALVQCE